MSLMLQPLRKYADFEGRARRSEYWLWVLFIFMVEFGAAALILISGRNSLLAGLISLVLVLAALASLVPSLAVAIRRLHDTDRSGWWLLIAFLPLIGGLVLLVFYLIEGTRGDNRFGPDPKAEPVEAF